MGAPSPYVSAPFPLCEEHTGLALILKQACEHSEHLGDTQLLLNSIAERQLGSKMHCPAVAANPIVPNPSARVGNQAASVFVTSLR